MAYPQRALRQNYLQQLMRGQYIPSSHLRLAHLLLTNKITNLVVTTNFDDLLTRALLMFGKEHIVCDHPKTALRVDPEREDLLQIIHVHGTYWFYDSSNLRGEIEERAGNFSQMEPLLANMLWARSPLVLGYGGWEGDVIMKALKQRLQSDLPYNLYWFCYKFTDVLSLPEWLVTNSQVQFIVPEREPDAETTDDGRSMQADTAAQATATPRGDAAAKSSVKYQQPAVKVLDQLIRTFELKEPNLTEDPLKFYAEQLRQSLERDADGNIIDNDYYIKKVIDTIELAKRLYDGRSPHPEAVSQEKAQPQAEASTQVEASLQVEAVLNALRRSQHREAVAIGSTIPPDSLNPQQLRVLLDAMWSASVGIYDNSDEELLGYEMVIKFGKELKDKWQQDDPQIRMHVAKALYNIGVTLGARNENEKALDMYQQVIDRFSTATETDVQGMVARAFFNKGRTLSALKRSDEELTAYSDLIKLFEEATEPAVAEWVASAYNSYGFRLLVEAKQALLDGDNQKWQELLIEADEKFEAALRRLPDDAVFLGNKGYNLFLRDDVDAARENLTRAITLGGEEIKKAELEDSTVNELPQDEKFRELVNSIPAPIVLTP